MIAKSCRVGRDHVTAEIVLSVNWLELHFDTPIFPHLL